MTGWRGAVAAAVLVDVSAGLAIVAAMRALVGHGPVDPGLFLAAYLPAAALAHMVLVMGWLWVPGLPALARRVLAAALALPCAFAAFYGAAAMLGYALRAAETALGYDTSGREPAEWLSTLWLGGSILVAAAVFGLGGFWGDQWDPALPQRVRLWRHMAGRAIGFGIVLAVVWGSLAFEGPWVGPLLTAWRPTVLLAPAVLATALAPGQALVAAVPGRTGGHHGCHPLLAGAGGDRLDRRGWPRPGAVRRCLGLVASPPCQRARPTARVHPAWLSWKGLLIRAALVSAVAAGTALGVWFTTRPFEAVLTQAMLQERVDGRPPIKGSRGPLRYAVHAMQVELRPDGRAGINMRFRGVAAGRSFDGALRGSSRPAHWNSAIVLRGFVVEDLTLERC